MKILSTDEVNELNILISLEVDLINTAFNKSEKLGRFCVNNSLSSFQEGYLKKKYGEILPQFSSEYRYLLIGMLQNIDDKFKELALNEVLMPKIKELNIEDI